MQTVPALLAMAMAEKIAKNDKLNQTIANIFAAEDRREEANTPAVMLLTAFGDGLVRCDHPPLGAIQVAPAHMANLAFHDATLPRHHYLVSYHSAALMPPTLVRPTARMSGGMKLFSLHSRSTLIDVDQCARVSPRIINYP